MFSWFHSSLAWWRLELHPSVHTGLACNNVLYPRTGICASGRQLPTKRFDGDRQVNSKNLSVLQSCIPVPVSCQLANTCPVEKPPLLPITALKASTWTSDVSIHKVSHNFPDGSTKYMLIYTSLWSTSKHSRYLWLSTWPAAVTFAGEILTAARRVWPTVARNVEPK